MVPVSPLKVVHPIQAAPVSFEQVLSNKPHSTLVMQLITSKKVSTALILSNLAKPIKSLHQASPDASDVKSKIVALLHTSDSVTASLCRATNPSLSKVQTRRNAF
jgi:hypothetical protein